MSRKSRRAQLRANQQKPSAGVITQKSGSGWSSDPATGRFFGPSLSSSGVAVTPFTALTVPAIYCATRVISEDIARMSLNVERKTSTNCFETIVHPLNQLFRRWNMWQGKYDAISFLASSYALRGNAYCVIIRNNDGTPAFLVPISPDSCSVCLMADGRVFYMISHPLLQESAGIPVRQEDMLHIKGMSGNGYVGISPIALLAESVGLSIALQQTAARTFSNVANIAGIIEYPDTVGAAEMSQIAEIWRQSYGGVTNAAKTAIIDGGGKFSKIAMTNEESQFLESRKFALTDIARIFRVPPHKLMMIESGAGESAAGKMIEVQHRQYIDETLRPFTERFEEEAEWKLLMLDERQTTRIRFDYDTLTKGTEMDRAEFYQSALNNGWYSRNEVRAREQLAPIAGGDEYRVSVQTLPNDKPKNNNSDVNDSDEDV